MNTPEQKPNPKIRFKLLIASILCAIGVCLIVFGILSCFSMIAAISISIGLEILAFMLSFVTLGIFYKTYT